MTPRTVTRVCVTGGAGFIGSHLGESLVRDGVKVRVLDDLSTGNPDNLTPMGGEVDFVRGSILDDAALDRAFAGGVDTVFHLAAYVSAAGSVAEPRVCHEINTTGTIRVLEACRRHGVGRVVFASSAAVYGDSEVVPKTEDQPIQPCSVYAQSKAAGEHLLRVWNHCHGLESVALRFFNVFGPRQSANSAYAAAIAAFADALLSGRPITIFGDGEQTRDFVPVSDIVQALTRAARWSGPARADVFNVGRGDAITIRRLASLMAELAGAPDNPTLKPVRAGDVRHSRADVSSIRAALGYEPSPSIAGILKATLDWRRATGNSPTPATSTSAKPSASTTS